MHFVVMQAPANELAVVPLFTLYFVRGEAVHSSVALLFGPEDWRIGTYTFVMITIFEF